MGAKPSSELTNGWKHNEEEEEEGEKQKNLSK